MYTLLKCIYAWRPRCASSLVFSFIFSLLQIKQVTFFRLLNVAWGKRGPLSLSLCIFLSNFHEIQEYTPTMNDVINVSQENFFYILRFFQLMFARSLERISKMYFKARKKGDSWERERRKYKTVNWKQQTVCFSCTPISNDLFLRRFFLFSFSAF